MDHNRVTRSYNSDYQNYDSVSVHILFDVILPSLTLNRLGACPTLPKCSDFGGV